MDKCKSPKIRPIFLNNNFIVSCKDKAVVFASFVSQQCKPLISDSTLPNFTYLIPAREAHLRTERQKSYCKKLIE